MSGLIFGAGAALVWIFIVPRYRTLDCRTAQRSASSAVALEVCEREYPRTNQPITGADLADLRRQARDFKGATRLATALLGSEVKGDALQILGKVAESEGRSEAAIKLLNDARRVHRAQSNHAQLARDDQALGRIYKEQYQYADALQMLDECIAEARLSDDEVIEPYCHLTAANVLGEAGYFDAAQQEIDRAAEHLSGDGNLAQLWLERGNLHQEFDRGLLHRDRNVEAVAALERSLDYALRAGSARILPNLHMNLAYSLAEVGRTAEAERHLEEAAQLDQANEYASQRAQLAARIAYRRGDLLLASSMNEKLFDSIKADEDGDYAERIDVCVMQARIALRLNRRDDVERWARRGVELAEKVRAAQPVSELRPWVLAGRREPFELLFTALVRLDRLDDAVLIFDQWQGRTLLDEMARPSPDPSPALASTATKIQRLGRWLPAVSRAPLMTGNRDAVQATLRQIDLVALVVAEGQLWRITVKHSSPVIDEIGPFAKLKDRLDRFITEPTDTAIADELGALLLPDNLIQSSDEPLYVVLDAPLAGLPFVALRRSHQPLVAARSVLRAPRLPVASSCDPRAERGNTLVLADAAGDLPDARRESRDVAQRFMTTPLVGAAATSTALFAAKSDQLLHVAVHSDIDAGGGVLRFHDRSVFAPEIAANKLGPTLVVLSACSTASSDDPEAASSLAMAFLAGGSQHVVATLRPVSDAGALDVTSRFYNAKGTGDPIRALAKIQRDLAGSGNKEWANFAVFGSCVPRV